MARREIVSYNLTCDVGGEEISGSDADDASHTISWQGGEYQVDLCDIHRGELNAALDALKVFVDAGQPTPTRRQRAKVAVSAKSRPAKRRPATAKPAAGPVRKTAVSAVRAWALENGLSVRDRGRIPAEVTAAYNHAQGTATPPETPKRRTRKKPAPSESK